MMPLFFSLLIAVLPLQELGQKIFQNECGGQTEKLVWWNTGENFASLGIGHFIWYPQDIQEAYVETFPQLLAFLCAEGVCIPDWLATTACCPWPTREAFLAPAEEGKKQELRLFLKSTLSQQAAFIEKQFSASLERLLSDVQEEKQSEVQAKIAVLSATVRGRFALIDYCNFKGDGTQETERYRDKGWGLKQVLLAMPVNAPDPLKAFVSAAKEILRQRVENAPLKRNESRWLNGWNARLDRY